ncbi:MAG: tRNA lysidine(34) synthetase TilS [SAR324 cluster bacterium]|nr:tRNA lysidine(34) synthetase TilS [SAR324 cluster bacterium]
MKGLLQQFQATIERESLLPSGTNLILCVSGGSDSIALLHLCHQLSRLFHWQLHILHFHHGLREESDEEARFVRDLSQRLNLEFHLRTTRDFQSETSGLQEKARHWRRTEALKLREEIRADSILTAHHAEDQLETWLLKWLRGAHLSGLQGMSRSDPPFIRPLLDFRKNMLSDFLKENGFEWREDASNQDSKYMRNRVRNELLPLLRTLSREGIESRIRDLDSQSRLLQKELESQYQIWLEKIGSVSELPISVIESESEFLQQEILVRFITGKTGIALSYRQLEKIYTLVRSSNNQWSYHLEGEWTINCEGGKLSLKEK